MSGGTDRRSLSRLWLDQRFVTLNEGEQLIAIYALTSPQTNQGGPYRISLAAAAANLGIDVETFRRRFFAVCGALEWQYDLETRVLDTHPATPRTAA